MQLFENSNVLQLKNATAFDQQVPLTYFRFQLCYERKYRPEDIIERMGTRSLMINPLLFVDIIGYKVQTSKL